MTSADGARDSCILHGFFLDEFSKPMGGKLPGLTNYLLRFAAQYEKRRPGLAPSAGRPSRNGRTGRYTC